MLRMTPPPEARGRRKSELISEVFDGFAAGADLGHGFDADLEVHFGVVFGDHFVGGFGFHAFGGGGDIGDEEQCAAGDLVVMPDDEDGCGFHVDGECGHAFEFASEFFIVFPESSVGGVDDAGAVFEVSLDDFVGDELVEFEAWECGDFGCEVVIAGAFASDGGDGEDEVSDFGGVFEAAAFSEEEYAVGHACAEEIHDGGGVW